MNLDEVKKIFTWAYQQGLVQSHAEDERFSGPMVTIRGKTAVNFASCSYLGLEQHPRVKEGAKDAIDRYGTQFSMSRAYLSLDLYRRLEELFAQIFLAPSLVLPSTTLSHLSALPTLVSTEDLVLFDHYVHNSVRMAANVLSARGVKCARLPHNDLKALEQKLEENKERKVWYLTDGIFSMAGDSTPMAELRRLLLVHPNLHLYIDDAHGMSWTGARGSGSVLQGAPPPERTVVALSLAKAFGVTGGVLVFSNAEELMKVRAAGETVIFSGPLTPPSLGAAIASAQLHLEESFVDLQKSLMERIRYFNSRAEELGLSLRSFDETPIRYITVGDPQTTMVLGKELLDRGYYLNVCSYPAVAPEDSGLRLTLTALVSLEQIDGLLSSVAQLLAAGR